MRTKPRWCPTVEATEQGWINSLNGELLVSLRNLKSLLALEQAALDAAAATIPKEVPMQVIKEEVVPVVAEVQVPVTEETIKKPKKKQKILGEVVEFPVDAQVIGE
jgi:hypothetical protein